MKNGLFILITLFWFFVGCTSSIVNIKKHCSIKEQVSIEREGLKDEISIINFNIKCTFDKGDIMNFEIVSKGYNLPRLVWYIAYEAKKTGALKKIYPEKHSIIMYTDAVEDYFIKTRWGGKVISKAETDTLEFTKKIEKLKFKFSWQNFTAFNLRAMWGKEKNSEYKDFFINVDKN